MEYKVISEADFLKLLKENHIDEGELPYLLVNKLKTNSKKIATAESCTGGLISKMITDQSGASAVFDCGVCSYANCIKEKVLGVSRTDLETFGAVSPQVAAQMADGIRKLADADLGISVTGIAGPAGGTEDKPVGTVFIGVSLKNSCLVFKGDFSANFNNRDKNRQLSALLAIYCGFSSI